MPTINPFLMLLASKRLNIKKYYATLASDKSQRRGGVGGCKGGAPEKRNKGWRGRYILLRFFPILNCHYICTTLLNLYISPMKILIACEYSGIVRDAFWRKGHDVTSCDILPCESENLGNHYQGDVRDILGDGWDMIIAFPPCTYLTVTGNRWFNIERYGEKAVKRYKDREEAIDFFMIFADADCPRIAIENPVGVMSTSWRKPNQIIHPYYFGDPERKATCLWLKNLPELTYNKKDYVKPNIIEYKNGKGTDSKWHVETMSLPSAERAKARSLTFPGIAEAMADQWG